MKALFQLVAVIVTAFSFSNTSAQSLSTIGLRLGGGFYGGGGAEINGRFGLESGRMEASLAWSGSEDHSSLFIAGVYQIVKPLEAGLDYYYGAGLALGTYSNRRFDNSGSFSLGVPFQLGIEYNFTELPLNLSLDLRPIITFRSSGIFVPSSLGLGVRYLF